MFDPLTEDVCVTLADAPSCEHCHPLRRDTNVLVLARLAELRWISSVNLRLAVLSMMYLGSNIVCVILNVADNDCYPCEEAAVSPEVFHRFEFSATFLFSLVSTFSLVYSPERSFSSPLLLRALLFCNVGATYIAAALVYLNVERFEIAAHNLEYSTELTMALFDLMLLRAMLDGSRSRRLVIGSVVVATGVAVAQLAIYNLRLPWTGERAAHFLEFSFGGGASAGIELRILVRCGLRRLRTSCLGRPPHDHTPQGSLAECLV
jgi:hypothetical protein